jgi:glycosyltransferase involved in cell wall biosynthesis
VQPVLVHAHTGEFATAALRLGLPTVYTVHGLAGRELRAPASIKEKLALLMLVAYERLALRRAAHVVALTPFGENYLQPHTHAVLHRIENPVAPRFFDLPPPAADRLLLTVGHLHPLKNQLTLVEAMRRVRVSRPDVTLHIVGGETHAAYAAALRRTLAEYQLAQQVVLRGRLSPSAVMDTLAEGALLLHAAHHEHAPMVIAEAMAAGRPVVASRAGGTPALVADGKTGFLVPATDAAAFAARTLQLLRDPELRQTMGQRARAVAQQRFWPDVIAARYRAVYFAAVGRPDPGLAADPPVAVHAAAPAASRH